VRVRTSRPANSWNRRRRRTYDGKREGTSRSRISEEVGPSNRETRGSSIEDGLLLEEQASHLGKRLRLKNKKSRQKGGGPSKGERGELQLTETSFF